MFCEFLMLCFCMVNIFFDAKYPAKGLKDGKESGEERERERQFVAIS